MKNFATDRQTLEDLNLLGRFKKDSVINIFDRTRTRGGQQMLEAMFRSPMTDAGEINRRSAEFSYYKGLGAEFPFTQEQIDAAEYWLAAGNATGRFSAAAGVFMYKCRQIFANDRNYEKLLESLSGVAAIACGTAALLGSFPDGNCPVKKEKDMLTAAFSGASLERLNAITATGGRMSLREAMSADSFLRVSLRPAVDAMMSLLPRIDVGLSVGAAAAERGFGFAEAVPAQDGSGRFFEMQGVWHPSLTKAVPNDVRIDSERNVFFLTGVNMAGKSTFMKAVSATLYLASMGFPVPVKKMSFTPVDGIYTSINVPDDISRGYSHFYAEVLRVKHIAREVQSGKNLFIIFDELFKGTNVKDAYDATLAVTEAYASHRNCLYIISTHIVEVGPAIAERCGNVQFRFLPAEMDGTVPVYTYRLADGISADRHGMTIIRNERILETIRGEISE